MNLKLGTVLKITPHNSYLFQQFSLYLFYSILHQPRKVLKVVALRTIRFDRLAGFQGPVAWQRLLPGTFLPSPRCPDISADPRSHRMTWCCYKRSDFDLSVFVDL